MTEAEEKAMVNEAKVKIFVDELSKSCPMLDYQKELLIRAIVNGCHNYLPYELELNRLGQLYYYREMIRRLRELLFFNKRRDYEEVNMKHTVFDKFKSMDIDEMAKGR